MHCVFAIQRNNTGEHLLLSDYKNESSQLYYFSAVSGTKLVTPYYLYRNFIAAKKELLFFNENHISPASWARCFVGNIGI